MSKANRSNWWVFAGVTPEYQPSLIMVVIDAMLKSRVKQTNKTKQRFENSHNLWDMVLLTLYKILAYWEEVLNKLITKETYWLVEYLSRPNTPWAQWGSEPDTFCACQAHSTLRTVNSSGIDWCYYTSSLWHAHCPITSKIQDFRFDNPRFLIWKSKIFKIFWKTWQMQVFVQ